MAEANLARCPSCNFDLDQSRSAYCQQCDTTISVDVCDAVLSQRCHSCNGKLVVFEDSSSLPICKFCLAAALEDPEKAGADEMTESLKTLTLAPVEQAAAALTDQLANDALTADGAEELHQLCASADESECASADQMLGAAAGMKLSDGAAVTDLEKNYLDELWRFVGCVCGNNEPYCFDLRSSQRLAKSFYCLDCQQPYGELLWSEKQQRDQCPRCNGSHVEMDEISCGDPVAVCLNCDSTVSKSRLDGHCEGVRQEVAAELGPQQHGANTGVCQHCDKAGAEWAVGWHDGDACLMLVCDACGSADFVADMGLKQQSEGQATTPGELEDKQETPAGYEELTRCCGSMATLHPVDDDSADDLLMCSRCAQLISLSECTSPEVPKTVSALRRALQDSFSSGQMGHPYRTVKVHCLEDLKPGDQLQFQRRLYAHHAILVETLPDIGKLAVIEYTGESNLPTVSACLTSAPSKACVTRSLLSFQEVEKSLHRVDYHSLDCYLPKVVIQRAGSRMGEELYNVGNYNCEHFSNWCKASVDLSRQVDKFKERGRQVLEHPVWDVVGKVAKDGIGVGRKRGMVVDILQDLRGELMHLFAMEKGAKDQVLKTVLRLGLKWGIRGLPLLISFIFKSQSKAQLIPQLDEILQPLAEKLADNFLPIEDNKEEKKGQ